jgi:hypothetical protein
MSANRLSHGTTFAGHRSFNAHLRVSGCSLRVFTHGRVAITSRDSAEHNATPRPGQMVVLRFGGESTFREQIWSIGLNKLQSEPLDDVRRPAQGTFLGLLWDSWPVCPQRCPSARPGRGPLELVEAGKEQNAQFGTGKASYDVGRPRCSRNAMRHMISNIRGLLHVIKPCWITVMTWPIPIGVALEVFQQGV